MDVIMRHQQDMDILISFCRAFYRLQDLSRFRVIGSNSTCQRQLAIHIPFHLSVDLYNPYRILKVIKSRNLGDHRLVIFYIIVQQGLINNLLRQFSVFVAQRVNGRGYEELSDRELFCK